MMEHRTLASPEIQNTTEDNEEEEKIIPLPLALFGEEIDKNNLKKPLNQNCAVSQVTDKVFITPPFVSNIMQRDVQGNPAIPLSGISSVGIPRSAPSWKELSSQVLPAAASELLSSSMKRIIHTARLSYAKSRWHRKYSDIGNPHTGYYRQNISLPSFSSLNWVDRQLVEEWRTIGSAGQDDDEDFEKARTLVPPTIKRPRWKKSEICETCRKPFGPTLLRHHCRLCGSSFCDAHSNQEHKLSHLGYDPQVPERVCLSCKMLLEEQSLAERVAWRAARCRDYFEGELTPYFETGIDTVEDIALRITNAAIAMARAIPLGAQAQIAVETVEVLRKHGLKGIYGLILRKEFLAAANLLCQACDINQSTFPLSVHELSAAIFYALAQHRAVRGMNPEREHLIHALCGNEDIEQIDRKSSQPFLADETASCMMNAGGLEKATVLDDTSDYDPKSRSINKVMNLVVIEKKSKKSESDLRTDRWERNRVKLHFRPVCHFVPDHVLNSCCFYAPLALNFIYAEKEVDMQLLAAQQGWRVLYAHLKQVQGCDMPGSALFLHEEQKIACFAIRGTATINDVVTDLKQIPIPFPESDSEESVDSDNWTPVFQGKGLAVCGMAKAAVNLYREHIDVLSSLTKKSYRVRIVGHSLGAGVAALLGTLIKCQFEAEISKFGKSVFSFNLEQLVHVYGYASPSCVDGALSDYQQSFVTTVVLHDDVVPRLTPTSMRGLVKHLLHIRETWVQIHMKNDIMAITERAKTVWAPRWRSSFTLRKASGFCRKHIQYGKKQILSVRGKLARKISHPVPERGQNEFSQTLEYASEDHDIHGEYSKQKLKYQYSVESENQKNISNLVVDYMGGIDNSVAGTIIDGEEYFDTEDLLVENENKRGVVSIETSLDDHSIEASNDDDSWASFDEHLNTECQLNEVDSFISEVKLEEDDDPSTVVLDETPLPNMFLPGKIVHIYTHRGGYKAAYVPRTFRDLRRISMAGNMLSDHTSKQYFEALMEVQAVRKAEERLPQWTSFDEDVTCSCCASRFTWASTSDSKAQEARDKHNCRSCGTLCCESCSKNRIPLPSLGLIVPVRVCDRCYHDMGDEASEILRTSFIQEREKNCARSTSLIAKGEEAKSQQCERKRDRRSLVVDDLASRINSTVVVFN